MKIKTDKIKKISKSSFTIYGMVIMAYVIMQILVSTGSLSSLMEGLLVPLCIYVILAVSLNLTVGILGELSLRHDSVYKVSNITPEFYLKK